jgi:hypothetical protein
MQNDISLVSIFLDELTKFNISGLNLVCGAKLQYHDPLMGYLHSDQVLYLWKYSIKNGIKYSHFQKPEVLGHGYYKAKGKLKYTLVNHSVNEQPFNLHLRIENGKVTEYSEAFSLHKMAQIHSPFWGWLLGWNKYYQNNMKIKARKSLFDLINQK